MSLLLLLIEPFRFIKHARERADADRALRASEREAERSHQLAMVESLVKMVESLAESQVRQAHEQSDALIEIAKSNQAQAATFSDWFKSFQLAPGDVPGSSVVTEEDEYDAEQMRMAQTYGLTPAAAADLPPEFALALQLQKGILDIGKTSPI